MCHFLPQTFHNDNDVDEAHSQIHTHTKQNGDIWLADSCLNRNKLNQGQLTVSILSAPLIANCFSVSS